MSILEETLYVGLPLQWMPAINCYISVDGYTTETFRNSTSFSVNGRRRWKNSMKFRRQPRSKTL